MMTNPFLRGYKLSLKKEFDLHIRQEWKSGIEILKVGGFAVVLSDM